MDGCAHIASATRIHAVHLDVLKYSCRAAAAAATSTTAVEAAAESCDKRRESGDCLWNCVTCGTGLSPWLCLSCGLIHCGRYVNQDGLRHFNRNASHCVCMDALSGALFCYACDDYVSEGDFLRPRIAAIRSSLPALVTHRHSDHSYYNPALLPPPSSLHSSSAAASHALKGGRQQRSAGLKTAGGKSLLRKPNVISHPTIVSAASNSAPAPAAATRTPSTPTPTPAATSRKRKVSPKRSVKRLQAEEIVLGIRGLRNLGNTCFMNAVLQSLNNIDAFAVQIAGVPESAFPGVASSSSSCVRTRRSVPEQLWLASELRKTLAALQSAGSGPISPDALFSVVWKLVPRFRGFQQQDAHEFLRCILERLGLELGLLCSSSADSLVTRLFQGHLSSRVTCRRCHHSSWKLDPFLDLSLDIPRGSGPRQSQPGITLDECLERFFAPEDLEGREQALCELCGAKTPSTKQFFLRRVPSVLCVHLKRFRWERGREKLDDHVAFPVDGEGLSLRRFVLPEGLVSPSDDPAHFRLAAVVVHHGAGPASGHYTAYGQRQATTPRQGTPLAWYHFNDSSVRRSAGDIVAQQKAYLLFYVRKPPPPDLSPSPLSSHLSPAPLS